MLKNPIDQFTIWWEDAKNTTKDRSAMALATATKNGIPSVRMVLLKSYSKNGFVFYTNLGSKKAQDLTSNPNAELLFYWNNKQVRINGIANKVKSSEADKYFSSRNEESKIVSILSRQSCILESEEEFFKKIEEYRKNINKDMLKRPEYWSGFCIVPKKIEFWIECGARNHKRYLYTQNEMDNWRIDRLYP